MDEQCTEEVLLYRQRRIAREGYGLGFKGHLGFSIQTDGSCPTEDSNYCLVPKEPHSPQVCLCSLWTACMLRISTLPIPLHTHQCLGSRLLIFAFPVNLFHFISILQDTEATMLLRDMAFRMVGGLGLSVGFNSCYLVELRQGSLSLTFLICKTGGTDSLTGLPWGSQRSAHIKSPLYREADNLGISQ